MSTEKEDLKTEEVEEVTVEENLEVKEIVEEELKTESEIRREEYNFANPMVSIGQFLKNSFNFGGVASRTEYWFAQLYLFIFSFVAILLVMGMYAISAVLGTIFIIPMVFLIIPGLSIGVRRLRDLGVSGWLFIPLCLISAIPYIGQILFIIPMCLATNAFKKNKMLS